MNLVDVLLNNVRRYSAKLALICGDTRLTYKDFNDRVNRIASVLNTLGIEKGGHFAILSKNCHRHYELFFAAAKTGAVHIPLNYRLSIRELEYIINDSEARVLFFGKEFVSVVKALKRVLRGTTGYVCTDDSVNNTICYEELLAQGSSLEPDTSSVSDEDLVAIFYTSGTTGYPKGTMISHKNRIFDMIQKVIDVDIEPEDVHLNIGPLYHIGAFAESQGHLYRGCTVVVLKEFDGKRIFELIEEESVRTFWAAPTMIQMLIDQIGEKEFDVSSVKTITYAGSPMPFELLKKAMTFFGPHVFVQVFGGTETGPQVSHLPRRDHVVQGAEKQMKKLRSVGIESQNVHVRIVDEQDLDVEIGQIGEIIVKSDGVTKGYWNKLEETRRSIKNGWFYTGDMGYMDENRYIFIVDRKKDMIITGGENVYSTEIENVLCMHPAVAEAAVIGVPHEKWVETPHAVVVLKPGVHATEEEIIEFCKMNLASYKKPTSLEFAAELPKTSSGKILKRELREKCRHVTHHPALE
jgi:long-chain acyl-CoA synthetase